MAIRWVIGLCELKGAPCQLVIDKESTGGARNIARHERADRIALRLGQPQAKLAAPP
jgi:hypothetical protein